MTKKNKCKHINYTSRIGDFAFLTNPPKYTVMHICKDCGYEWQEVVQPRDTRSEYDQIELKFKTK